MNDDKVEQVKGALAEAGGFCDAVLSENARIAAEEQAAADSQLLAGTIEAAYLMAIADGEITQEEADALTDGVYKLTDVTTETMQALYSVAEARFQNEGAAARIQALGNDIPDDEHRRGAFLVAAAVSWKGGGIGVKQGLALQALARAFGIPMNEMHKLLAKAHG